MNGPIKVLVVDDSLMFRTAIAKGLGADPAIQVVASAANAYEAREKILEQKPDVITLDVEMPGMNGLDFLKALMPQIPIPVVVVSAVNGIVFEAMHSGAVDFVAKPSGQNGLNVFIDDLKSKIKIAATVNVSRQTARIPLLEQKVNILTQKDIKPHGPVSLIAIGASTGGTEATSAVLKVLPATLPPIVITQHMPPVFTKMYAERLHRECAMAVKEAENGDVLQPGMAYVAPGDFQVRVVKKNYKYVLQCEAGAKVSGHCPSVDVLFESVAQCAGSDSVGIILTGMGADGAKGMLKMKNAGAYTIGQDRNTCVVYGMPMEAFKLGAVIKQAPLENIAPLLRAYLKK